MASDYDAIRIEHRRRYGEDVGDYGELLVDLYADRTHFVFELLQNAQDAHASRIKFELRADRLDVTHDGRAFTERDVRGICGIKRSTKSDDPEQIGRFGIGFKSVYAYTKRPVIHCGAEHFAIHDYVYPYAVDPRDPGSGGSTLQVFPFDHPGVSADDAAVQIGARLEHLSPRAVLFLRSLRELEWVAADGSSGTILREEEQDGDARRVRLIDSAEPETAPEEWLVFERPVELTSDGPPNRVEVAFLLVRDEHDHERIVGANHTELVAFFPTSRETHLGFLVQGPFVPTPARDNVRDGDAVNQLLAEAGAALTVAAMESIRERDLLDAGFLECLPLDLDAFPQGSLLRPIYDQVRRALIDRPLVPTADGRHLPAAEIRLARGAGLRELLSAPQLGALLGEAREIAWGTSAISQDRSAELYRYFIGYRSYYPRIIQAPPLAPGMEVDPAEVVRRLSAEFLSQQSDEWMIELYDWLSGQRAMIADLRKRPIVRCADGGHVAAFEDDVQQIWLPPEGETAYPTVAPLIASDERAHKFLQQLGLTEPDAVDDVLTSLLPRYTGDGDIPADYLSDLARIAAVLDGATGEKRLMLLERLRAVQFLIGRNAADDTVYWCSAAELTEPTEELETFLAGNDQAYFVDDRCMAQVRCWRELGVNSDFRITRQTADRRGYVVVVDIDRDHQRGRDAFDPGFDIEGLAHAVQHPTLERSQIVWNLLARLNVPLRGQVEKSTRQDYARSTFVEKISPAGELVMSHDWLLHVDGSWRSPGELSLDDLDPGFARDEGLAIRLGMRPSVGREVAEYLDIEPDDLELLRRNPDLVQAMLDSVRNAQEQVDAEDVEDGAEGEAGDRAAEPLDVDEAVHAAFNREARGEVEQFDSNGSAVDPARRRARSAAALDDAKANEPVQARRQRLVRRVEWEARDPTVREYLRHTYGGCCQICGAAFRRWDGRVYFEAKYLVPRTAARWVETSGNTLCLCPTCLAKMLYGSVAAPNIVEDLIELAGRAPALPDGASISFELCGEQVELRFAQRHLIDVGVFLSGGTSAAPVDNDGSRQP